MVYQYDEFIAASADDCDETNLGTVEDSDNAAMLSTLYYGAGFRFTDVDVPQGATINEAVLWIRYGYGCGDSPYCNNTIYGVDDDDCDAWTTTAPSATTKTTATTTWNITGNFTPDTLYATQSVNVTSIVQEIVDRGGWSSGNHMGFVIVRGSYCKLCAISINTYDFAANQCMELKIDYTAPTGTNMQINIGDAWKEIDAMQINIGDTWKEVAGMQINIGDTWKEVF